MTRTDALRSLRRPPRSQPVKPLWTALSDQHSWTYQPVPGIGGTYMIHGSVVTHYGGHSMTVDDLAVVVRGARRVVVGRHPGTGRPLADSDD